MKITSPRTDSVAPRRRLKTSAAAVPRRLGSIALGILWLAGVTAARAQNHSEIFFDASGTDQAGYGGNQIITISGNVTYYGRRDPAPTGPSSGTVTQDFVQPASDVYILPHGYYKWGPGGQNLHLIIEDVSGTPNTVLGAGGGGFFEQAIASTGPQGPLKSGEYDVVLDEHQNGYFEPAFDLYLGGKGFAPAITVAIPVDVPIPRSPAITAMKTAGQAQYNSAALLNKAFRVIEIAYDKISEDGVKAELKEVFKTIKKEFRKDPDDDAPFKLGFTAARNALANKMKQGLGLVADPPDANFERAVTPAPALRAAATDANPLLAAAGDFANALDREARLEAALLSSLEKYLGAGEAQNGRWALAHAREAAQFADLLAAELARNGPVWEAMKTATASANAGGLNLDALLSANRALRARLRAGGFSAVEDRFLADMGLSASRADLLESFLAAEAPVSGAEWLAALDAKTAASATGPASFTQLAEEMRSLVDSILTIPTLDRDDPVVTAAGPFTVAAGAPLTLSATGVDAWGRDMTYEWDLDDDGEYDDATGAAPEVTPATPHAGLAAVRVTNDGGRVAYGYALLTVTGENQPPVFSDALPAAPAAEVAVGTTAVFSIAAADPEGSVVSLRWTLDGTPTGEGGSFSLTPTAAQKGLRELAVTARDEGGAERTRVWLLAVTQSSPLADLAMTLKGPEAPAQPGAEFTWTLTVENRGPTAAPEVRVGQTLPAGLSITRVSTSFGKVWESNGAVSANLGTMEPGGLATVWVQTTAAVPGDYQSAGEVSSDAFDSDSGNNTATARVRVTAPTEGAADVGLTAAVAPSPVTAGGTQTISLTTTNHGPDAATDLILETQLPEGVEFLSSSPAALSSEDGLVRLALPDLAPDAVSTATLTVRPTLPGSAPAYAQVFGARNDPALSNNRTSVTLVSESAPSLLSDLTVTQTAPLSARVGLPATWTISVSNNGPAAARNVTVLDRLPAGAEFVSAVPAPASLSHDQAAFALGDLAPGAQSVIRLTVSPGVAGPAINAATATSDSVDANGADSLSPCAVQGPPTTSANLSVALAASAPDAAPGADVTLTVTAENAGPDSATDVISRTTLPEGLTFVSAVSSQGAVTAQGGTATAALGALASGAEATVAITARVTAARPLAVVTDVSSADIDPEGSGNHASVRVLGRDPSAAVALVRNLEDPEIPALQGYLTELGLTSQVFEDEDLTSADIAAYRLIIWDDLSYAAFGIRPPLIDVLQAAADAGKPLYFIGDDLAYVTTFALTEPHATRWTNLVHLKPTEDNGGGGGMEMSNSAHPVTNGLFGEVGGSGYNLDPDVTTATGFYGETVLARTGGGADTVVAFKDPVTGRKSLTQNELAYTAAADETSLGERKKLFKNGIVWLLSDDQPVDLAVSQSAPVTLPLGGTGRITLTIINRGPGTATGVTLTDTLPAGLHYVSGTVSRGTFTENGGGVTASPGVLAPNETAVVTLNVSGETVGAAVHSVSVLSAEQETAAADNISSRTVSVIPAGTALLTANYRFENTLSPCQPGVPSLAAIDPQNSGGYATVDIGGRSTRVYRWNGDRVPGGGAGLRLDAAGLLPPSNYSLEMLFRLTGPGGVSRLVDASGGTDDSGLSMDEEGRMRIGGNPPEADRAAAGAFHHVVLTVAPEGDVTTYLDGRKQSTLPGISALNLPPSGRLVFFAANGAGPGSTESSDGEIALLRVYEGVLPENRVAAQAAFPFGPDRAMNACRDLSVEGNPLGVWTAGYSTTRGTPFVASSLIYGGDPAVITWSATGDGPHLVRNRTDYSLNYATILQPPDLLNLDPSFDGRNSVLRWTAPLAGLYRVQGRFQGIDTNPNGTDIALLKNGDIAETLFESTLNGFDTREPFDVTVPLEAGDTVDFSVGTGGNSNLFDSTGLDAVVTPLELRDDCGRGTDLAVSQRLEPASAAPGESVVCILTVTNSGPRAAVGVILSDTLPPGLAAARDQQPGVQRTGNDLTFLVGDLGAGESRSVALTMSGVTPGSFTNAAQVAAAGFDPSPANNTSTAVLKIGALTPLAAGVRSTVTSAPVGGEFTFELTMANAGGNTVAGSVLTAALPANAAFVSATGGVTPTGGVLTFPARDLPAGGTAGYAVRLRGVVPGAATVSARVSAPGGAAREAEDGASVTITLPAPDLRITIVTDPAQPQAGTEVTYRFTVTNASSTPAVGVKFDAPIPAGLVPLSSAATQGDAAVTAAGAGRRLTASLGTVRQGVPVEVTLRALATSAETTVVGARVSGGTLPEDLLHRWSFNEPAATAVPGAVLYDSVGGANGAVRGVNAVSTGEGVRLPGGPPESGAYVDLPNGLISPLPQVTLEGWMTLNAAGGAWAHTLSFGSSSPGGEFGEVTGPGNTNGEGDEGLDYVSLTASVETNYDSQRLALRNAEAGGAEEYATDSGAATPISQRVHFAVTIDSTAPGHMSARYYRDGMPQSAIDDIPFNLSDLRDVNNWLGRGNWTSYGTLAATFDEFRIYGRALSASEVLATALAGPDTLAGTVAPGHETTSAAAFLARDYTAAPAGVSRMNPVALEIFPAPEVNSYELEWTANPGRLYLLQSSADLLRWVNNPELIPAAESLESWIDPGPPATERPAAAEPARYYRLFELQP